MNKDLINYISRGRGAGVLDEELRDVLLDAGWLPEEVNEALVEAGSHLPIINALPPPLELPLGWSPAHRGVFGTVIIILVTIFVGATGVLAYRLYGQNHNPDRVGAQFLTAVSRVSGFDYDGTLDLNIEYQSMMASNSSSSVELPEVLIHEQSTTSLTFSGSLVSPEGKRPRLLLASKVAVDSLNHGAFGADLEARLIDDSLYLFLSKIEQSSVDWQSLTGFWLAFTPADAAEIGVASNITAPSANQLLVWRQAIARSQSFHLIKLLDREKLGDINTRRYAFAFDLGNSGDLLDAVAHLDPSGDLASQVKVLANQGVIGGEIWLGTDDNLPYRVVINSIVDPVQPDNKTKADIRLVLNLHNFNHGAAVDQPALARSLSSVLTDLSKP